MLGPLIPSASIKFSSMFVDSLVASINLLEIEL